MSKEFVVVFLLFFFVSGIFFYKSLLKGYIAFPGDILIAEYAPWRTSSYLGYNPGSYPNKAQYFDTIRQFYPWRTFSLSQIREGKWPLWNPYNFSGAPLFANFQSSMLYPLNVFYFLVPQDIAWNTVLFLQLFLSLFFTYLYSREIGIGKNGALLTSVAYSISLFMIVFFEYGIIGHTILWLPLILYSVEKMFKRISFYHCLLFVVSIVSSFFAGHLQLFMLLLGFVTLYILFLFVRSKKSKESLLHLFLILILIGFSFGITSIQLLPTIELLNNSARVPHEYYYFMEKLLIQPYQLILFLVPDIFGNPAYRNFTLEESYPGNALYIGLIPFIFSLFAFYQLKSNKYIPFFFAVSLLILVMIVRTPLTELVYSFDIPFFSASSPSNMIFLLSFCLSVLAGFGVEFFIRNFRRSQLMIIGFVGVLFIILWIQLLVFNHGISRNNIIYSTGIFGLFVVVFLMLCIKKTKKHIVVLMIFFTIADLLYFFHKFNPFVPASLIFPSHEVLSFLQEKTGINRIWGYGGAEIQANFTTQYNLFSPDGYDPLYPKLYGEFVQSSKDGKLASSFNSTNRSDAVVASGYGATDLPENTARLKVLDILGVKYILDRTENGNTEKTFPSDRFERIYNNDNWQIYENKKAVPRVFFTNKYDVYKSNQEFESKLFLNSDKQIDFILLGKDPHIKQTSEFTGISKLVSYQPNEIVIKTRSTDDGILFLSDTYYPGWKATIDGKEREILKAFYAFRAVVVTKGQHTVVFSYRPESFLLGLKVSIISLVALAVFMVLTSKMLYAKE